MMGFGPATGSFFLFSFVRVFYFDFLHACTATKLVNVTPTWLRSLCSTSLSFIDWLFGLSIMAANILGSQAGGMLAIAHGSQFVRKIFLIVALALIARSAYSAFFYN